MVTNNLITNNSLNNPDLCAARGRGGCRSFLCLLHLSLAAGGSSNPDIWELSSVYTDFSPKDFCPTYEVPLKDTEGSLKAGYLWQVEDLKMDLES